MTDDDTDARGPTPDSDPNHIDPAGDLADMVEEQLTDAELGEDTDVDDVRAFVDAAESGELGPADPALEAQVRIARAVLDAAADGDDTGEGEP